MESKKPVSGLLLALCGIWVSAGAQAQDVQPAPAELQLQEPKPEVGPPPGRRIVRPELAAAATGPYRLGDFLFYPEMVATFMHDSNVFATKSERVSDWAMTYSPTMWLKSDWQRHAVNVQAAADVTYYHSQRGEDTRDWRVSGEGRYDITSDFNIYGGLRHARDHEDRESKDNTNGTEPTIYFNTRAYGGVFRQFGGFSVRVAGTYQTLDFRDVPFITGQGGSATINNDDRDRDRYTLGLRVGYGLSARTEAFVQAAMDNRRYDQVDDLGTPEGAPELAGLRRDSDGYRLLLGARYNQPRQLKAEAYAGMLSQDYKDARLSDATRPAMGANVVWSVSDATRLSAFIDRTLEETSLATLATIGGVDVVTGVASSYLNTYLGATVDHRVVTGLGLYGNASFSRSDYIGISRTDDYTGVGAGIWYRAARHLYVDASYQYRYLLSSEGEQNFDRNQFFLRLSVPLVP